MASKLAIPYRKILLRSYYSLRISFFNAYSNTGLLCRWFPIWYGLKISHTIQEYVTQMLRFARNIIFQRILQYWSFMSLVSYMVWPQNQPYHIGICYLDVTVRSEHHFSTYTSILVFYVVGFLYGMASKLAIPYRNMLLRCYGSLGTSFFNVYFNTGLLCRWFPIWYGLKISHTIQEYVTQMLRFARNIIFQRILQYWSFMSLVSYMVWPQNQPYHIGICYLDVTVRSEHHFSTYTSILVFYVVGFLYGMASKLAIPYRNMLLRCYGSLGTSFFNVYFNTGLLCRWFPIWYGLKISHTIQEYVTQILRFARNIIFQRILQYWSFMSLVSYMVWPQNQPYHIGICYLDVTVRSEHHFSTYTSILVFYVVGFLYGMASKLAIPYRKILLRSYYSLRTSFFNVYFNTGLLCRWFPIWYGLKISHTIQENITQILLFAFMQLVSEYHFSTHTPILVFYVVGFLYGMASKLAIPYRNMLLRCYGSLGTSFFNVYFNTGLLCRWFPIWYGLKISHTIQEYVTQMLRFARNIIFQRILQYWSFMSLVSYMVWPQNQPYHIGICDLDLTVRSEHHFSTYTSILVFYVVGFLYGMASKLAIPYRNMLLRCYGSLGTSFFNVYFNTGLLCRWFPIWYGLKISHTIQEYVTQMLRFARNIIFKRILQYWSFMSLVSYMVWPQNQPYHIGICYLEVTVRSEHRFSTYTSILVFYVVGFLYGMASKLAIPYRNMLLRCYGSLGTSFFNVYFNTGLLCRWFPIWYGLKISHTIQEYVTQMLRFARNIIFQRILQYWSFMSLVSYMVWPQNQPYHIGICYLDLTVRSEHHFSTYTSILVFYVVGFLYGMASKLAIPYRNMLLRCYGSLGTSFFNVYFNTGLLCRWFPIWYGLKISHTIQEYVTQRLRFARNIVFQRILQYWSFMSLVSYMVWPQNQPYHIGICYLDVTVRSEHHFSTYTSILVFYVVGFLYGMASKLAIPYRNMLLRCYGSLGTSFFNVYFNTGLLCRWFPIWYGLKISHTIQEYVTYMLRFARNIVFQRILQYWSFMSLVSYMVWPQNQPYHIGICYLDVTVRSEHHFSTYTSILVFYVVGFLYGMA